MEISNRKNALYAVISIMAAIIAIASELALINLRVFYRRTFQAPVYIWALEIAAPIVISVLFYIKIAMRKSVSRRLRMVVNIIALLIIVVGASFYERNINLLFFSIDFPKTAVYLCMQLCATLHDVPLPCQALKNSTR